jgi:hypothetical protein
MSDEEHHQVDQDHSRKQRAGDRALERLGIVSNNWTVGDWIIILLAITMGMAIVIIAVCGYVFSEWEWTGLTKPKLRTFWDWLDLLIVPTVLALGGYLFTRSENNRTLEIANKQREVDREIAEQRGQDDALQAYLDQIGQLLLDEERSLRESKVGDEERTFARARTKEVLWKLSPHRKRNVLQFLYEACLIKRDNKVIDLSGADLRNAYLWKLDLKNADLTGTDIKGANLSEAKLSGADLRGSMLGRADLREANLVGVDLSNAKEWTEDQLIAAHLEGATMPNNHTYEDWLKDKEGRGRIWRTAALLNSR